MARLSTDPEGPHRWSWRGVGGVVRAFVIIVLLIDFVAMLVGHGPAKPSAKVSPRPTPSVAGSDAPIPPFAESVAPAPSAQAAIPVPTPRALPASNAFTTLEDYRRRRAHAPHPPEPLTPPPAGRTPETELGRVSLLVRDYRAAYGANPVGNNREIVRTLLGDNPRGTKFLDPATVNLNERGELLDAWGRPYFFHALSGTAMEIRSAGPDGKAFTPDDLVR